MLPSAIGHLGLEYDLGHLTQVFRSFSWKCIDGSIVDFIVRVRYSDHCISVARALPIGVGEHVFGAPENCRIFDPDRYLWSLELPEIIEGLFSKPTTQIQLTPERNGYVFRMGMKHPLGDGEKYYCFVRLKRSFASENEQPIVKLDLFIESAYPRDVEPMRIGERHMFGRLAERLAK